MLTRDHVRSTDKLARFVGIEAYEAAGGAVVRDLVEDDLTFLTDRPLLVKLAMERLDHAAEPLKIKGWKWVEGSLEASAIRNGGFGHIFPVQRVHTEAEQAELSRLGVEFDEIAARIDAYAEDDPARDADEAALAGVEQAIAAIQTAATVYDMDEKALAGCIVTVTQGGTLQIEKGLVRAEDMEALRRLRQPETAGDDNDEGDEAASAGSAPAPEDDDEDEKPAAYSAALVEELTAIRTAAMRNELVSRPNLALASMLYPLVMDVFHSGPRYMRAASAVEISGQAKDLAPSIKEPEACAAFAAWEHTHETWSYKVPGDPVDVWRWLLAQSRDELDDLMAVVVAGNINGVEAKHDHSRDRLAHADRLAVALGLDMNNHWTPQAPFLSRLSKVQIVEVMTEAGCAKRAIKAVGKDTKAKAVETAEKELKGKTWLPALFRSPIKGEGSEE